MKRFEVDALVKIGSDTGYVIAVLGDTVVVRVATRTGGYRAIAVSANLLDEIKTKKAA